MAGYSNGYFSRKKLLDAKGPFGDNVFKTPARCTCVYYSRDIRIKRTMRTNNATYCLWELCTAKSEKRPCFGNWSLIIGHWAFWYMEQCNDLLC